MKKLLSISLVFLSLGCLSKNETKYIIPKIENLRQNFEKSRIDPIEAFVLASKLLEDSVNNLEEIDEIKKIIEAVKLKIEEQYKNNVEKNNYNEGLKYGIAGNLIGFIDRESLVNTYSSYINYIENSTDTFTYENLLNEAAGYRLYNSDLVEKLFSIYKERNDIDRYRELYELISKDELFKGKIKPEYKSYIDSFKHNNEKIDFQSIMQSAVTITLDKGFKIEKGVTFFDKSIGSGFFIDEQHIITNYHVIRDHVDPKYKGFSKVTISTRDEPNKEIPVKVVGYDSVFDLALLKTPNKHSHYLKIGKTEVLSVGDRVYTIGNPLGLKYSVTSGIIGGKEVKLFELGKAYHIDAPVNPGNSGGPLLDENGLVIGIVFAGLIEFQGLNFVIPFKYIRDTLPLLYKGDRVQRTWIGAGIFEEKGKVIVYYVMPFGPSEIAGLKDGDVIISINDNEVKSVEDAQKFISYLRDGGLARVKYLRDGIEIDKLIRVENRPEIPMETVFSKDTQTNIMKLLFGLDLEYYQGSLFSKRFIVRGVNKNVLQKELSIDIGNHIFLYDLKYVEKDRAIVLTMRFRDHEYGVFERMLGIKIPAYSSNMF